MQQIIFHIFIFVYGSIAVFTFTYFVTFVITITYGKERPSALAVIRTLVFGILITAFWPLCGVIAFGIKEGEKHNRLKEMDEKRGAKK